MEAGDDLQTLGNIFHFEPGKLEAETALLCEQQQSVCETQTWKYVNMCGMMVYAERARSTVYKSFSPDIDVNMVLK